MLFVPFPGQKGYDFVSPGEEPFAIAPGGVGRVGFGDLVGLARKAG